MKIKGGSSGIGCFWILLGLGLFFLLFAIGAVLANRPETLVPVINALKN